MRGFKDALANSVVIAVLVTLGTVLSSSLVALAFARVRFRGSRPLFLVMLGTMMLPGQVTMIPLFILFRNLGWVDTMLPLVVPSFFGSAYFIFMYRQFIAQVPEAHVEQANVDFSRCQGIAWHVLVQRWRP
ncbi:MAG: carbohydrate ABC transporter permease, partial [Phycisphaerales bacterium]